MTCDFVFQLRGAQILDAVRLHKNGFPESIGYSEFWRKFHLLAVAAAGEKDGATKATSKPAPALGEIRGAVEKLLVALEIDRSAVRMGNTQVRSEGKRTSTLLGHSPMEHGVFLSMGRDSCGRQRLG